MAKAKRAKVTVLGAGLSYKGEVDVSVAGQIIAWCLSEDRVDTQGPLVATAIESGPALMHSVDLNESSSEYFNRYAPKRNPDKILTLASFLKNVRGQNNFTTKDIKSLFRDVGEILPANFKRDFGWASKKNGWLGKEPGEKDTYYVTNTGTQALEAGFSKAVLNKTKITVRGHARAKKVKNNP
jgi:hypothetical protein